VQYIRIRKIRPSETRRVPAEKGPFQAARELRGASQTAGYCPKSGKGETGTFFGAADRVRAGDPGKAEERVVDRAGGEDAVPVKTGGGGRFEKTAQKIIGVR
jgi:hypothetical protein